MSTWASRTVRCVCGHLQAMDLADGLHITRLPEVRQRILDGTFHTATCGRCGRIGVVHTKTLYTDFSRWHWVAVAPPWLLGDWQRWARVVTGEFDHWMRIAAPPMVRELADRFAVRLVFGFDALAEKLRAWDAGLDDRVVEALKLRVARAELGHLGPGFRLRLAWVDRAAWELAFEATRVGVEDRTTFVLSLDEYSMTAARPDELEVGMPELYETPFGGVDRVFAGSLAGATPMTDYMTVVGPLRPQDESAAYPVPAPDELEDASRNRAAHADASG